MARILATKRRSDSRGQMPSGRSPSPSSPLHAKADADADASVRGWTRRPSLVKFRGPRARGPTRVSRRCPRPIFPGTGLKRKYHVSGKIRKHLAGPAGPPRLHYPARGALFCLEVDSGRRSCGATLKRNKNGRVMSLFPGATALFPFSYIYINK